MNSGDLVGFDWEEVSRIIGDDEHDDDWVMLGS